MYKKYTHGIGIPKQVYRKIWLIMRLTTIILLITLLQVSAATRAQNVTLKKTNASLKSIFREVKKQTGFMVLYPSALVNNTKPVTVNLTNTPLKDAMGRILENQNLDFEIQDNSIVVRQKETVPGEQTRTATAAINVSGKITDEQGQPLPGATVKVKDGKGATTTDVRGEFRLKQVGPGAVLVITFIGYQSKEVSAAENLGAIQLLVADSKLDEVQVIAYGRTSQRLGTGNVTTVKAADIAKQPVNNPLLALQASVPGLFITQTSGNPGAAVNVKLQGSNSLSYGDSRPPLYVVDGAYYEVNMLDNGLGIIGGGNPLSYINPADIESISVLKDADATAIYGSKAANGAILITTKKGKAGKMAVNVNGRQGFSRITRKLDLLNTPQYLEMRKEAIKNNGRTIGPADWDINGRWDTTKTHDFQQELFGKGAVYADYGANISGGNEQVQYLIGANYHRETAIVLDNFQDQKAGLNLNLNGTSANKRFRFSFSGNYQADHNRLPQADITSLIYQLPPTAPSLTTAGGDINWMVDNGTSYFPYNPLRYREDKNNLRVNNLVANMQLSYELAKGLTFNTSLGYNRFDLQNTLTFPLAALPPPNRAGQSPSAQFFDNQTSSWVIEPQLKYNTMLGGGSLEVLTGATIQQLREEGTTITGFGFSDDLLLDNIRFATTAVVDNRVDNRYKYNAWFGRLTYNLKDKYILNLSGRRDGSSRFGPENRFHNFAAAGAAWIFSSENGIKQALPWLSFGKLKVSYGTTGSDQIGNYQYLDQYDPISGANNYQGVVGLIPNKIANPYLQWEATRKFNAGADLGVLKDRILLNVNYFINRSSNLLYYTDLPSITGFGLLQENFNAVVENSGLEATLTTTNLSSPVFTWKTNINVTLPKNKLISYPGLENTSDRDRYVIGKPVDVTKVYHYIGVDPEEGVYQVADANGNPTKNPDPAKDRTGLVSQIPKFFGGLTNTLSYKSFTLDFTFQFISRNAPNNRFGVSRAGRYLQNQLAIIMDRWQKPGDEAQFQQFDATGQFSRYLGYANQSDAAYSNTSYARLNNANLSWTLPQRWLQKAGISRATIFVQGQNLLTISNSRMLDPETLSISQLPPLKTWTFGFNCGF